MFRAEEEKNKEEKDEDENEKEDLSDGDLNKCVQLIVHVDTLFA